MDDNTNLNSGFGQMTNWGQGPQLPGQGTRGVPGDTRGTPQTTGPVADETQWKDVIQNFIHTTDDRTEASFNFQDYLTNPNSPRLQQSLVNDPQLAFQGLKLLQNPSATVLEELFAKLINLNGETNSNNKSTVLNSNVPSDQKFVQFATNDPEIISLSQKTGILPETLVKNFQHVDEGLFAQQVAKFPKDVAEKLMVAHFVSKEAEKLSLELKTMLTTLETQIKTMINDPQILALAQKTGAPVETIIKNLQETGNSIFEQLLSKLPRDVADKLTFAHFIPEEAKNLSPELQAQLASIEKQVKEGMANVANFSSDFTGVPPDATDFVTTLTKHAGSLFEQQITANLEAGTITEADARTLRAMHNGLATGTSTLKNLLAQIQSQVTTQMQARYGFDVSYQPPTETLFYNNVINGDFAQTFQKMVEKYTGKATVEQKALLELFAKNPNDPAIPENLKPMLQQLAQQIAQERQLLLKAFPNMDSLPKELQSAGKQLLVESKNAIITKYGLDLTWQPTVTSLFAPGVDPKSVAIANSGMATAKEIIDKATVAGNNMPDGPEKEQYLNFLKLISQALTGLQDAIYSMQMSQTSRAKSSNQAKLDMQLNDIEKQQQAADKAAEQAKKIRSLGPLGKIFEWVIKILLMVISVFFGPLAILFSMAFITDSIVSAAMGNKRTGLEMIFDKITESMPSGAAAAVKGVLFVVISLCIQNPYMITELFCNECNIVKDIVATCGGNKMAQELVNMVVTLMIQMAMLVFTMILTSGSSTALLVEKITEQIVRATETTLQMAQKLVAINKIIFCVITSSIQITTSSIKLNNSLKLANIDIIKGDAEKYSEEVQALIEILKKLVAKLLAMLQGNTDAIVSISNFQGKKWSDANQLSSEIFG